MSTTYNNVLIREETTMALEHVLVAPEGTAWAIGRIDPSSPPAGFIHLGATQDDSPRVAVTKGKFQLFTGIPRGLSYEVVMQLQGEVSMVLHSYSNLKSQMGGGGPRAINVPISAHTSTPPVVEAGTVSRTQVTVNTTAGFVVGMRVVTDASSAVPTSFNESYVTSVGADRLYLSTDGFHFVPVVGQPIVGQERSDYGLGSSILPYYRVLGVADLLNNGQIIHDFQRATPRGQWEERLAVGQDIRVPIMFDLFTYPTTRYGGSQLIVGERFVFAGNTLA